MVPKPRSSSRVRRGRLSGTHVVLGEAGNVAGDGLEPVQAVLSCGKLDDSAADAVHSDDLERVFPERGRRGRRSGRVRIRPGQIASGNVNSVFLGYWLINPEASGMGIEEDYSDYCKG